MSVGVILVDVSLVVSASIVDYLDRLVSATTGDIDLSTQLLTHKPNARPAFAAAVTPCFCYALSVAAVQFSSEIFRVA